MRALHVLKILFIVATVAIGVGLVTACGDSDDDNAGPTSSGIVQTFDNADTLPKSKIHNEDVDIVGQMTLAASEPGDLGAFSRFSFYFLELVPNYDVMYIDEPTDCATGEPAEVAGEAFLEVKFTPARAHDDEGNSTHFPSSDDPDTMPAIEDIVQTCDFEGDLTFVFGLVQPDLKFRVNTLTRIGLRETIAIDIENP
jgi:hypothetical protein